MNKSLLWNVGKYILALTLMTYVVWANWYPPKGCTTGGIADALGKPIQITPLVLATFFCFFGVSLTFVRWYVLVRAQDLPFTFWNAIRLGLIGYYLSTFLPGSIGGDVIKAAFLAKEQKNRRTVAVATVLIDRGIGLWGLFWLVAILGSIFWVSGDSALSNPTLQYLVLGSVLVVVCSVLTWVLLGLLPEWRANRFAGRLTRLPKVGHAASELWRAVWMYRRKGGSIALALGMTVVAHIGFVLAFYFAAQVFLRPDADEKIPTLAEHFLLVPVGVTVQALAPLPGGAGVGELSFGALYKLVLGQSAEAQGVLASLVSRAITWGLGLIGYLVYLRMKPSLPTDKDLASEDSLTRNGSALEPAFGGISKDAPSLSVKTE